MGAVAAADRPLVVIAGARLGYPSRVLLEGVELTLRAGDFLGVVGPNGSGKTTLLKTVLGTIPPLAGTCVVKARLGYCPQRAHLDTVFPFTAGEVVRMGLIAPHAAALRPRADELVRSALADCGLAEHIDRPFRAMSGGQRQRVLLARALVSQPEAVILDEPTNDLDLRGEHEVLELVSRLHAAGNTVVVVSHQLGLVARYASRIALIDGSVLETGPTAAILTRERLSRLYGLPIAVGEFEGRPIVAPARAGATP